GAELLARAAAAGAGRVAGLGHEPLDDAVEHHAVVEAFARELLDTGDVLRREVGPHLHGHAAFGRLDDQGVLWFSHGKSPPDPTAGVLSGHHLVGKPVPTFPDDALFLSII